MINKILITIACLVYSIDSQAQSIKLINDSKWADAAKVDGKLDEWGTLRYDKQNNLWFGLANNDKYLYVALKRDKNTSKIDRGGVNLILRSNKKDQISITYPALLSGKVDFDIIRSEGISAIPDSVISVYNEYGIKAAMVKETEANGLVYNIEFAIPLKLIKENMPGYNNQELDYAIVLKGSSNTKAAALIMSSSIEAPTPELREKVLDLYTRTEFKGMYKIAAGSE